jgi:branched-chain amino acid aminotransferase
LSEAVYKEGVHVGIARHLKRPDPQVKSADFVLKRRSFLEKRSNLFEALLIDEQGYIMEGTSSNFYAIEDGVLWTAAQGVLEGTARTILIEVAKEMKMPIRYAAFHMGDIKRLDECAISSSSRDIVPVVRIDDQVIGSGLPGPITPRLLQAYRTYVEQAIMPAFELDDNSQAR